MNEIRPNKNFFLPFFSLAGRLERPSAPVVVTANHYSIELEWEHVRIQDEKRPRHRRLFDESGAAHSGSLIYLHQREKKLASIWENIYTYVYRYIYFL